MKILHTADWHFGKQLHTYSLSEEMDLFVNWLIDVLQKEAIDILLISGDIFDVSNPANADKERYFSFLKRLRDLKVKTIITGGNHDSVSYLNASKSYLKYDDIFVIGGATEHLEDEIISFEINGEKAVVCAVPFLRDKDLRNTLSDQKFTSRQEAIKAGILQHYQDLRALVTKKYPDVPTIAMGHLFAIGSVTSESERDIYIGNSGAVSAGVFQGFDYVALGHIHKPQVIAGNEMIRYSGSPIPLSFSEKKDEKQVVILSVEKGKIQSPKIVKIPKFRELKRFLGTLVEVKNKLSQFVNDSPLPAFIELEIREEEYDFECVQQMNQFVENYNDSHTNQIIKPKISFKHGSKNVDNLYEEGTTIQDLSERDVFQKKIVAELPEAKESQKSELEETFNELLARYFEE